MKPNEFHRYAKPLLDERKLDLLLITKIVNVQYLTGFTGSSGFVVVDEKGCLFLTDPRYTEQAKRECTGWEVEEIRGVKLSHWLKARYSPSRVGVDEWVYAGSLERMKKELDSAEFEVVFNVVEPLRVKKHEWELERIKTALAVAEEAFTETLEYVKPGVMERDLALELEFRMRRKGAKSASFDIIVASGYRSSLPHGVASSKRIKEGELILFDFGCVYEGYCSDITRVVKLGRVLEEEKRIWRIVVDALESAVIGVKEGMQASQLHGIAQSVIEEAGFGRFFGHGLGHGVGREIHEAPSISPLSEDRIERGAVFTVEPGIYLPSRFGVRIEDMIYMGGEPEVLTTLYREIVEL